MGRWTTLEYVQLIGCALAIVGCGGGGGGPSLQGDWISQTSDSSAAYVNLGSDGTYAAGLILITSASATGATADVEKEAGTYTATDTTIYWTPQTYTCPGADAAYSTPYHFTNGQLVIDFGTGLLSLLPNNSTSMSTYVITYGCFASGTFTASPAHSVGP